MSWPWARNVLVAVAEAVRLGEAGGLVGAKAGPLGDVAELGAEAEAGALAGLEAAAELLDELQAVTSKAAQASEAQAATCRDLRAVEVNMNFPLISGSVSHVTHTTSAEPPWLEAAWPGRETTARSA
jgi:hypothetical protein